ncbi:protein CROWDED NUCLEI 1 [Prunus yedoensis var. nudiflora]|uniref:Protein CROWDED NUCLEI 1 n=1 Tax=Prunus yedoensis var. nudiflora TaxID=2094558 RepID=A0A314ZF60_PRUYE|nr:protein CROWDED NUCLEI 1 [Prunus yedoensis var. nudiflora]
MLEDVTGLEISYSSEFGNSVHVRTRDSAKRLKADTETLVTEQKFLFFVRISNFNSPEFRNSDRFQGFVDSLTWLWRACAYEVEVTICRSGIIVVESFLMFTPQRWSGWSLTPKTGAEKTGTGSGSNMKSGAPNFNSGDGVVAKGKGLSLFEPRTPASGSVLENGGICRWSLARGPPTAKSWLRGFQSSKMSLFFWVMGKAFNLCIVSGSEKVLEFILFRGMGICDLGELLFEYQYNMGLLLIEKKEWTSRHEELRQSLTEAKDAVRREQAAHLIAISEIEKREENLRKALGVEKQCVHDRKLCMRFVQKMQKLSLLADSKLAEANALVASIEEKSLELEAKSRAADAKLAEVSRKSSEFERKSKDLEARESALRRDRLSFNSEQEAHENSLSKRREDLLEWERKLQEGEERLAKEREDLEDAQKKIDATNETLKRKEDDISSRLANLTLKEKEYDTMRINLEMKEKELLALEEKLNARERVELQKIIDEHNAILDAKKCEFELEIDQKRKSLDDELRNRLVDVEKKESEINHMEEKVAKREQALKRKGKRSGKREGL